MFHFRSLEIVTLKVFNCVGEWNRGGEDAEVDDRLDSLSRDDKKSAF